MGKNYFPLFIDLTGRRVLVVGGGAVAERRVRALLPFGCSLTVVAPAVSPGILELADQKKIRLEQREYREGDEDGCALVLAAANDRAVNHTVVRQAAQAGAFYNAADCKVTFSFPASLWAVGSQRALRQTGGIIALRAGRPNGSAHCWKRLRGKSNGYKGGIPHADHPRWEP